VIDAHAKPLTADDDRSAAERQAEALADVCGYVLDHGSRDVVPDTGGQRPHVNVLIRLEDLESRARAACLDFGGPVAPESLRILCCDARLIPPRWIDPEQKPRRRALPHLAAAL
jgi:5-methylcytosine-specific restriction protein A